MENDIHALRKRVDSLIRGAQELELGTGPQKYKDQEKIKREIEYSLKALQEAKHWLGECLGKLGQPLPPEYADKSEE